MTTLTRTKTTTTNQGPLRLSRRSSSWALALGPFLVGVGSFSTASRLKSFSLSNSNSWRRERGDNEEVEEEANDAYDEEEEDTRN